MIISIHSHLFLSPDQLGESYLEQWVRISTVLANRPPERLREVMEEWWDPTGEIFIKEMDEAKIDKAVLLIMDLYSGGKEGEPKMSIEEQHRLHAEIVRNYPERFIAFAGVDPRREGAPQLLERYVKEYGMKGLKLYPQQGYYPNDRIVYPLYKECMKLGIPVLCHTGPSFSSYSKYAQPIHLDEVATDFPDLPLIAAHSGLGWWSEAASIAANNPNIFLDLSAWQPRLRTNPREFYTTFRTILDWVGALRVLWGTDAPMFKRIINHQDWVKAFTDPPQWVKEAGIEFSGREISAFLGGNAAKLLGL